METANAARLSHYVVLSIVGVDGLTESGYMRAKAAQEQTVAESDQPYTIVRATQFHDFAETITASLTADGEVRVPDALIQPIAAADVAAEVAGIAQASPVNGAVNIGGPEKLHFAELSTLVVDWGSPGRWISEIAGRWSPEPIRNEGRQRLKTHLVCKRLGSG